MRLLGRKKKKYDEDLRTFYKIIEEANYVPTGYYVSDFYADFRKHYKKYINLIMENMAFDAFSTIEAPVIFAFLDAMTQNEKTNIIEKQRIKKLQCIDHQVGVYKGGLIYAEKCKELLLEDKVSNERELKKYEALKNSLHLKEKSYEN